MSIIESRLAAVGLVLPRPPIISGNYRHGVAVGELLFLAGAFGTFVDANDRDVLLHKGKLGKDLTIDQGYQSARLAALNHLAMMKLVVGNLDRIKGIVQMTGYVHAAPGFQQAPAVVNGASDLFVEVLGKEQGAHARASLYQHEMTWDAPIETVVVVQIALNK